MLTPNPPQLNPSPHRKRLAIKGFNWISSQICNDKNSVLGSRGFKNFSIDDQKKKWKIRNCQNFRGFGERIEQLLRHKQDLYEEKTNNAKKELFQKQVEEISLINKFGKMDKLKQVTFIYEKQKNYQASVIQNFFHQEVQWIHQRFN